MLRIHEITSNWCKQQDLNLRPSDLQSDTLPTELCLQWGDRRELHSRIPESQSGSLLIKIRPHQYSLGIITHSGWLACVSNDKMNINLAVDVGFEPTGHLRTLRFSRPLHSPLCQSTNHSLICQYMY